MIDKQAIDGIEIEQKLLESIDIADKYDFSEGKYKDLQPYEKREKVIADLYKKYKHLVVTKDDKVYGFQNETYGLIKTASGLYNDVQNTGRI